MEPITPPVVSKDPAPAQSPEPVTEPPQERESKGTAGKTEAPEPEKTADKPAVTEPPTEIPVASPSKTSPKPSGAPGSSNKATTSQPKLSAADKKKQADAQKKEEVQRAAEQSYEAGLQFIRESRDADAIKAFRQAVKLAPDSADAWLRLAYLCEKEGKTEEALRAFKEAKRLWSF